MLSVSKALEPVQKQFQIVILFEIQNSQTKSIPVSVIGFKSDVDHTYFEWFSVPITELVTVKLSIPFQMVFGLFLMVKSIEMAFWPIRNGKM